MSEAPTIREEVERKLELLERYRALRLEAMLQELRAQAEQERERGFFPWKGRFRSREEILALYETRRRYDRRFLLDTVVLAVLCFVTLVAGTALVRINLPGPNKFREAGGPAAAEPGD